MAKALFLQILIQEAEKMKIYIAGPISTNEDYQNKFKEAEEQLKKLGHIPMNPVKNVGFEYKDYIDMGLTELSKCDGIILLNGWESSNGARLEMDYAITVGLEILFYSDIDVLEEA